MATSIKTACTTTPISTGTKKDLHREQLQRAGLSAALGVQIQAVRHVQEGKEQEHAVGGAPLIQVVLVAEHQRIEDIDDQQDTGGNAAYPVHPFARLREGDVHVHGKEARPCIADQHISQKEPRAAEEHHDPQHRAGAAVQIKYAAVRHIGDGGDGHHPCDDPDVPVMAHPLPVAEIQRAQQQ